ncbi:HIRAN domain-containing protein [Pseudomonas sp.]|uniref:HIRAN domain-containing protein n=1 Tax=Pseudomonas sp. TaxID=306 RepID=UPI003BB72F30
MTEPENPHDSNACAIYIDGYKVGYLPRDAAANFVDQMAAQGAHGVLSARPVSSLQRETSTFRSWATIADLARPLSAKCGRGPGGGRRKWSYGLPTKLGAIQ